MKTGTIIIIVSIILAISVITNAYFIFNIFNEEEEEFISIQYSEGNKTYKKILKNYYDVTYEKTKKGVEFKINNPCIEIITSTGNSMKPYRDFEELVIIDTCFPDDKLEIGDIVIYIGELDSTKNPHHSIIDIDYEKKWIRTQGDNRETNPIPDDFVGFDRIYGKDIGFLNVLMDKKVVKEEVINETTISLFIDTKIINFTFFKRLETCVCSTTGIIEVCHDNKTELQMDTFISENDLKEEYCK